ncbi:GNAT family N-acetyltransferase [Hwanghaeella sp.]|uniref:GNAT family N-acetyltransferase n=1 Tax=Hwanghaeella sp. TaxID=2605943 RepID=UPI003CCC35E4
MNFTLSEEAAEHAAAIESLVDTAFGPARKTRTVYQFRDGIPPLTDLCYVALSNDGDMLGSIRFWPVLMPDGRQEVMLGPLAVLPNLRGQGIGKALVAHGIAGSRAAGFGGVLIVGDRRYYAPFGFREEKVANLDLPGPVAPLTFMGLEFEEGSLSRVDGTVMPYREKAEQAV